MIRGKINQKLRFVLLASFTILINPNRVSTAAAPVEESRPIESFHQPKSNSSSSSVSKSATESSRNSTEPADLSQTSHLIETIYQIRQDVMEIRGQMEEHTFRIEQLEQESRDRYVDLDERITRLKVRTEETSEQTSAQQQATKVPGSTASKNVDKKNLSSSKTQETGYQDAFNFIRDKKFDKAKEKLQDYLKTYPNGRYADNAYYWLGEVDLAQGNYENARDSFQLILNQFPQSSKRPDASYKLGRVHELLGNNKKSREFMESVIKEYPESSAARLSDTYLRTLDGYQ